MQLLPLPLNTNTMSCPLLGPCRLCVHLVSLLQQWLLLHQLMALPAGTAVRLAAPVTRHWRMTRSLAPLLLLLLLVVLLPSLLMMAAVVKTW